MSREHTSTSEHIIPMQLPLPLPLLLLAVVAFMATAGLAQHTILPGGEQESVATSDRRHAPVGSTQPQWLTFNNTNAAVGSASKERYLQPHSCGGNGGYSGRLHEVLPWQRKLRCLVMVAQ